ncbi:hypothetical protein CR513_53495, partial [Mucuna pruriens]
MKFEDLRALWNDFLVVLVLGNNVGFKTIEYKLQKIGQRQARLGLWICLMGGVLVEESDGNVVRSVEEDLPATQ